MERWKDAPGYEGRYFVSNEGNLMNVKTGKVLSPGFNSHGYPRVLLTNSEGKKKNELVHRLVALAFVPNPEGKSEVNHIDMRKTNCNALNLEWVTRAENMQKAHHWEKSEALRSIARNAVREAMEEEALRREELERRIAALEKKAARLGVEL